MIEYYYRKLATYAFLGLVGVGASRPRIFKNGGKADGKVYGAWRKEMETRLLAIEYKDVSEEEGIVLGLRVDCVYAMPKSWSNKKRAEMLGRLKVSKPDLDNVLKAIKDAMFKKDEVVAALETVKYWGLDNEVKVTVYRCEAEADDVFVTQ